MGNFKQSEMLYDDGKYYKWSAATDGDNPKKIGGIDRFELDRTQGYEVLNFINQIGDDRWKSTPNTGTYHKIEKMIRYDVPSNLRKHTDIANWIVSNWNSY